MADAADRFLFSQQRSDVEDMGSEFSAYQHDAQWKQQLAWFDGCGGGHLLKICFEGRRLKGGSQLELTYELDKEPGLCGSPFRLDSVDVDGGRRLEEEGRLLNEIGEQVTPVFDEIEHPLKTAGGMAGLAKRETDHLGIGHGYAGGIAEQWR